ncbi:MAG: hypothetical protein M3404_01845 [Actinomycetota bacterium]|nr:hypothetical protein [Actinomycetota bacterium]
MSYDIWLEADLGGSERLQVTERPGNYTYNVDPMFAEALGSTDWLRTASEVLSKHQPALAIFRDERAGDCIGRLKEAVVAMEADPERFRAMNPSNGWGNYEGALEYLRDFLAVCEEAPDAVVVMFL